MQGQGFREGRREGHDAVLTTFAPVDADLAAIEVQIVEADLNQLADARQSTMLDQFLARPLPLYAASHMARRARVPKSTVPALSTTPSPCRRRGESLTSRKEPRSANPETHGIRRPQ